MIVGPGGGLGGPVPKFCRSRSADCAHFKEHASRWMLHTADWMRQAMGREKVRVIVDGEEAGEVPFVERIEVKIPKGTGLHTLGVE